MHLALISPGLLPVSSFLRPSRVMLRPSAVSKSATTALINGFDPGFILALTSSEPLAKLSFRRPQSPLGSAAVTAIPAIMTLSSRSFHSSGVKFDLSDIGRYSSTCAVVGLIEVFAASTAGTAPAVDDRGL